MSYNCLSIDEALAQCTSCIRRIIRHLEHKYECTLDDYYRKDFEQEGKLAVLRALNWYKPSCGLSFVSYANQAIYNAIVDVFMAELERTKVLDYFDKTTEYDDYSEDCWERVPAHP